ncbi:MAG: agmatine deiminase family protein [Paraprevotella sp.]|nr:agmatine deiminase family protein [Paraprevotella sp.]
MNNIKKPIICTSPYLRTTSYCNGVAKDLFAALDRLGIQHMELSNTMDIWCRDYMPVLLFDDGYYATYQYQPDYLWDKKCNRKYITNQTNASKGLEINTSLSMGLVFDGGNYVRHNDKRKSTVFMTDKILMENSFCPSHELIVKLHLSLAADIVLLPWDMDEPYGHADGMVAPLPDGRLLLNNYCQTAKGKKIDYYKRLLKMLDGHFPFVELSYDCKLEEDSWCYLNFLKVPGAVLLPCLSRGAKCDNDQAAIEKFQELFPDDEIIPIYAKSLINRGGGLHCVTWEYFPYNNRCMP